MSFIKDAKDFAREIMDQLEPRLSDRYSVLIEYLSDNPAMSADMPGKSTVKVGSEEYIRVQARRFIKGREPKTPVPPATIPDDMVGVILNKYFDVPISEVDQAKKLHHLSMGAENIVGDLLERYIASVMEDYGWVWCAGSVVKAVDFIFRDANGNWTSLQIKNRDNSENSSSSNIRKGTDIKKWFRTFAKTGDFNWNEFPVKTSDKLSEEQFRKFAEQYLFNLKKITS